MELLFLPIVKKHIHKSMFMRFIEKCRVCVRACACVSECVRACVWMCVHVDESDISQSLSLDQVCQTCLYMAATKGLVGAKLYVCVD